MHDRSALHQFFLSSNRISASSAAEMAEVFHPYELKQDAYLLRSGDVSDTYLFLESGWMRGFAITPEGDEVTTGIFSPGNVVFEVSSFFLRVPSQENIQALEDCRAWSVNFEELNGLFHSRAEFREFGRAILVRGYASLKGRMLSMISLTAEQRYEALLRHHPEAFQHVPLKHIASYLGVTDSSLSRIRREFARKSMAPAKG
ncbi:MAG: Crp/Fnr family transcriptional regulator [Bacteroidia bacterium]